MSLKHLGVSRRSLVIATAAIATVISLGLGAHAALNKMSIGAVQAVSSLGAQPGAGETLRPSRLALVIGNSRYPDANAPLAQPINDARAVTAALRHDGFEVDVVEDANKEDMRRAFDRLKARVQRDTVVMLYYSGFGIQANRQTFMIPVDAAIWREVDVRRQGTSVESVLDELNERGARASLVVLDASRRNPYERRFRTYSHGLAPIDAPRNALILSSATPGKVVDESTAENSPLAAELLSNMNDQGLGAEQIFNRTRIGVSRKSNGNQVPTVSSSLVEDVRFGSHPRLGS